MKFRTAAVFLSFFLFAGLVAAATVIQAGTGSYRYTPGATITVSGSVYEGTSAANGSSVNASIYAASGYSYGGYSYGTGEIISSAATTTSSAGAFSASLAAPQAVDNYVVNVSSGGSSIILPIRVSNISTLLLDLVGQSIVVELSSSAGGITADPAITGDKKYGSVTYNSTPFYFIASKSSGSSSYDTIFLDDDANLTFAASADSGNAVVQKYLQQESKASLTTVSFTVEYIDSAGGRAVLGQRYSPVFYGTGSETANILVIAKGADGSPVSAANISLSFYNSSGSSESPGTVYPGVTGSNGTITYNFTVSSTGGIHFVSSEGASISYNVKKFFLRPSFESSDGEAIFVTAPSQSAVLSAGVLSTTTQAAISTATVTAVVSGPGGYSSSNTLSYNSSTESYRASYTIPATEGEYSVEFRASYNGSSSSVSIPFYVQAFDFSAFPVSKGREGASSGFAPSQQGILIVGAKNLSGGGFANLSSLTSQCNSSLVYIDGLYLANGSNLYNNAFSAATPLYNFSAYISAMTGGAEQIPDFILEDFESQAGSDACVLFLTAPATTGLYDAKINVSINSATTQISTTVSVQDVFFNAFPMSSQGGFQMSVSPGQTLYLAIEGYDSLTGTRIEAENISSARLIEVFDENGNAVTDKMLNEGFATIGVGKTFKAINFTVNDSSMGFHFARFQVTASVLRNSLPQNITATGEGFFQEALYRVWAYPQIDFNFSMGGGMSSSGGGMRGVFGSNDNVSMKVEVRDASGMAGQSDIQVTLANVMHMESMQNIETASAQTCTTNSNGTCTLAVSNSDPWISGGYNVRVKIQDSNNITDYGWGWFEVRNFQLWAWTQNWEVSTSAPINISVSASSFNGTPLTGVANVSRIMYFGTMSSWQPPTVANASVVGAGIVLTGQGYGSSTLSIPAGSISREGQYAAIITATTSQGVETAQAWFYSRPFVLWAERANLSDNNWDHRFGTNSNITLQAIGLDNTQTWGWPPTGQNHSLQGAWVQSIEKMGMWGTSYKTKQDLQNGNGMGFSCSGNSCTLWFNTSGFAQGEYTAKIVANDSQGQRAESWFWFRLESLRLTVPELDNWRRIFSNAAMRNSTIITINNDCGTTSDVPVEPTNLTNCKYDAVRLLDEAITGMSNGSFQSQQYPYTFFVLDKNSSAPRLYVNNTPSTLFNYNPENPPSPNVNVTNFASLTALSNGSTFLDANGTNWTIASFDLSNNQVVLHTTNGIIVNDTNLGGRTYFLAINQLLSKSGTFLYAYEKLFDEQWRGVDLDADGNFNDQYLMMLADSQTSGVYDLLLVANSTTATGARIVNSSGAIRFHPSASPIFVTQIKYTRGASGGGVDYYQPTFTSNRPGWTGVELGTFKPGTVVKVPVMVMRPGTSQSFGFGVPVKIVSLSSFGKFSTSYPISNSNCVNNNCSPTTDPQSGVAVVQLNTSTLSGLQTGQYMVEIQARDPSDNTTWVGLNSFWEYPKIELRNFEVRGEFGTRGQLHSIGVLSQAAGTLTTLLSDEMPVNGTNWFYFVRNEGPSNEYSIFRSGDWQMQSVWVNYSNVDNTTKIQIDTNNDGTPDLPQYSYPAQNTIPVTTQRGSLAYYTFSGQFNPNMPSLDFVMTWVSADQVDANPWEWRKIVRVANYSYGGNAYTLLVYNDISINTSADYNGGKWMYDRIKLVNSSNPNQIINASIRVGQYVPQLGQAFVGGDVHSEAILMTNYSIGGQYVRGLPSWSCDAKVFYVANFTEQSGNVKIMQSMGPGMDQRTLDNSTQFYLMFFDDTCDGASSPSQAILGGDVDFSSDWANGMPYDYDSPESNATSLLCGGGGYCGESWIRVGQNSWPFTITVFDASNPGNVTADLFNYQQGGTRQGDVLNLWAQAREFDGSNVNGNITVGRVTGFTYGCGSGPMETDFTSNFSGVVAQVTNGNAYLTFNTSTLSSGDYAMLFTVANSQGLTERLDKQMYVMGSMGGGMGGPGPSPGPGTGGPVGCEVGGGPGGPGMGGPMP